MKLTRIGLGQVKGGMYYISCALCGVSLKRTTPDDVVEVANEKGWKYDYENDLVICPDCLEEYKKEVAEEEEVF